MDDFIVKLPFQVDLDRVSTDLDELLKHYHWTLPENIIQNQMGIKHRLGAKNVWLDASGSLYDKKTNSFTGSEYDFTEWNPHLPTYTRSIIEYLENDQRVKIGRARFMLLPSRKGLSIHRDFEKRYHLVIKTNPSALFGIAENSGPVKAVCYHIPADGHFYEVDTTKDHFVYNAGDDDRIHLVLNIIKE